MSLGNTKTAFAAEVSPQSAEHWVRLVFSAVITAVGVFVVIIECLHHSISWVGPVMVFGGVGVAFTKTVVSLAKAILPFKSSRNGT